MVWGEAGRPNTEEGYGIAHIIRRRQELGQNLEKVLNDLQEVIEKGKISVQRGERFYISYGGKAVIVKPTFNKKKLQFVLTAFEIKD